MDLWNGGVKPAPPDAYIVFTKNRFADLPEFPKETRIYYWMLLFLEDVSIIKLYL